MSERTDTRRVKERKRQARSEDLTWLQSGAESGWEGG